MSRKKCPKCNTWNENQEECTNCGHLLNYWKQREVSIAENEKVRAEALNDKLDDFVEAWKNSRWWILKGLYYFFYSIWFSLMAIVSFIVMIVAALPG
jgi:Zn ribbon nucleic-acid-binding protein